MLIERLKNVTRVRGKKAELAEFLGVPSVSVSRWLSGDVEPGGEFTLRLLEWVQAAEATNKSGPGGVTSTTGARTRSRQSKHEKPKSNPPG
jgi:transcriptional regulator with XRE-family HTH domain